DGGGVRGFVSLVTLKYILEEVKEKDKCATLPKPCEYFDMIAGISTGGLIAIMLGVLDLDIDTCIEAYRYLAEVVFSEPTSFLA
ncbi:hypothetical protein GQ44DRAFT_591420, partial [Phaeosphaeriaceae sp. PMI808]